MTDAKTTTPTSANESKQKAHLLSIPGEHRFRMENLAFGIDVWYRRLASVTFRTEFEPLTQAQGQAIVAFYKTRFNGSKRLTTAHVSVLLDLEMRLDSLLKKHFPDGAFMRLSDRSPKDADPLDKTAIWKEYLHQLEMVRQQASPTDDAGNVKMIAIGRVNFLRVTNGAEAMSLLLTSERVFSDCLDWLEYGEPVMVALREFEPGVTLENEFRAFISCNRLTAISQYDHYTFYPQLEAKKEHLGALILQEWTRIHPLVGEESYCVDFAYFANRDEVKLIEISPFLPCTGPACFNWKNDIDILRGDTENKSFEFRIITKPRPNMEEVIEANWDARWTTETLPYFATYYTVTAPPIAAPPSGFFAGFRNLLSTKKLGTFPSVSVDPQEWITSIRANYIQQISLPPAPALTHKLFVYGTLKSGFHWHKKFLSRAQFFSKAQTVLSFPLVVGQCGVPYLLGDQPDKGLPLLGEVFLVDDELLAGMDDYEGVSKNYYERREIQVIASVDSQTYAAFVYLLPTSDESLRKLEPIPEYSQEIHDKFYKPIQHIQVKQQRYLGTLDTYTVQT